jgi:hypothetical protein
VLIDTDAVTQLSPPPVSLRTSPRYEYVGVRNWRGNDARHTYAIDPGVLRAQDRFGFALVVLTALAGRDWVTRVLLWTGDTGDGRRPIEDRAQVAAALRRHWPDTRDRAWAPLIDALVEPFGTEIEVENWSSAGWIARLLDAERQCVRSADADPPPLPQGDVIRFRNELAQIRSEARALPAPRPERVRHAYDALARHADDVVMRNAAISALTWAGALIGVVLVLVISALGLEK